MSDTPTKRPVLRYHGGKWLMAPWIIDHMPTHAAYVECFGGGESGPNARPMHPDWARSLRDQCNAAGGTGFHGDRVHMMKRVPREAAGRFLDGLQWNEVPDAKA